MDKRVAIAIAGHTYYGREALQGILQYRLEHAGWQVHAESALNSTAVDRTIGALKDWKADGIIIQLCDDTILKDILKAGIPAIDIGYHFATPLTVVDVDNEAVGRMAAEFFLKKDFRNLAYCGQDEWDYHLGRSGHSGYTSCSVFSGLRAKGFLEAAERKGIKGRVYSPVFKPDKSDWIYELAQLKKWLLELPKPVGVLASHDYRGNDIIWACHDVGLSVPDDVAVISVDNDTAECNMGLMSLSSIAMPMRQIGYKAAETLDRMMRTGYRPAEPVLIPPIEVVVRNSSDAICFEDDDIRQALIYIRKHACEPIRVSDILTDVPISRRLLECKFAKTLGRSPRQEIMHAHMQEAKRLLVETDLRVPEVAAQAGFTQHQVFSKLFREATQMTPIKYRQRFRTT